MPNITSLFVTRLYRAGLNDLAKKKVDYAELRMTCDAVAEDDEAGQEWCETNGYPGYTSYASLDDLPWRMPIFGDLEKALDKHVAAFCKELGFDLGDKTPEVQFPLDQHPARRRHPRQPHPPAFGDLGHDLCRDAGGDQRR